MLDFECFITNQHQMTYKWMMRFYDCWFTASLWPFSSCPGWTGLPVSFYLSSPDICSWSLHVKLYMTDQKLSQCVNLRQKGESKSSGKGSDEIISLCIGAEGLLDADRFAGLTRHSGWSCSPLDNVQATRLKSVLWASPASLEGGFLPLSAPFFGRCSLRWVSCSYLTGFYQVLGGEMKSFKFNSSWVISLGYSCFIVFYAFNLF